MSSTKSDAEGGLREFVERQKALPGECNLTFYRFDQEIERLFEAKPLKSVSQEELRLDPRGCTALLDAMSRAIDEVGKRLEAKPENERPEHVIFVTITDGYENASVTPKLVVFEKITRQRNQYSWEFVFIGANQDAIATAASIGIAPQYAITYNQTGIGTKAVYASMSNTVASARSGQTTGFSAEDRNKVTTAK